MSNSQILILSLFVSYLIVRPFYLGFRFAYPRRMRVSFFTPTSLGVSYEDVKLKTRDNVTLIGWYVASQNGAAVLLVHDYGLNRLAMVQQAEALIRSGYGVLMLDLRAHGHSGGEKFGRSQKLVDDLLTAVAWLRKRRDVHDAGIGMLGEGVGAMFALQAATQSVAIRAIVIDGIKLATEEDIPDTQSLIARILHWPYQRLVMRVANCFAKLPPIQANTAVAARLAPRPLLAMAGGQGMGYRVSERLVETAVDPKTFWHVPIARDTRTIRANPEQYIQKMLTFFNQYLRLDMQSSEAEETVEAIEPLEPSVELEDRTISFGWANVIAFLIIPISFALFFAPYFWLWGEFPTDPLRFFSTLGLFGVFFVFLISIFIHELLHGVGYTAVGKVSWSDVKFGFSWKGLAPYAHCKAPMTASAYKTAVALPGIILGLIPAVIGILLGNWGFLLYGFAMFITAGGDIAILLAIWSLDGQTIVQDHPSEVGCQIVKSTS